MPHKRWPWQSSSLSQSPSETPQGFELEQQPLRHWHVSPDPSHPVKESVKWNAKGLVLNFFFLNFHYDNFGLQHFLVDSQYILKETLRQISKICATDRHHKNLIGKCGDWLIFDPSTSLLCARISSLFHQSNGIKFCVNKWILSILKLRVNCYKWWPRKVLLAAKNVTKGVVNNIKCNLWENFD